jgi:hypothetical protein
MASDEITHRSQSSAAESKKRGSYNPGASSQPSAADLTLTEDSALALLKRPDLLPEIFDQFAKNGCLLKYRKVKLALVEHPRTPRHMSLPIVRSLFTFDLMQIALTPTTPADVKIAAEEALCNRLESISSGERLSLARRASAKVAGALLHDQEPRIIHAALENPRLTEAAVVRAVLRLDAPIALIEAVSHHAQWSCRREVRVALLRNQKTPMARAIEFARSVPLRELREILQNSRLPTNIKAYLLNDLERRAGGLRRTARAGGG